MAKDKVEPINHTLMENDPDYVDRLEISGLTKFTCFCREKDEDRNGYNYHVNSVVELDKLDFKGKTVLINNVERKCKDFDVIDGNIVIFVESPLSG